MFKCDKFSISLCTGRYGSHVVLYAHHISSTFGRCLRLTSASKDSFIFMSVHRVPLHEADVRLRARNYHVDNTGCHGRYVHVTLRALCDGGLQDQ